MLTDRELEMIETCSQLLRDFVDTMPKGMIASNTEPFMRGVNHLQTLVMARSAQRQYAVFQWAPEKQEPGGHTFTMI
jgi:hypothetical protein